MIFIDEQKCTQCGDCVEACPWQALSLAEGKLTVDRDLCAECGACLRLCPLDAIYEVEPAPVTAIDKEAKPALRADRTTVARPAKPARTPAFTFPATTPSPLWMGVLPLAARFAAGLTDWWLERKRPAAWDRRGGPVARRGPRGEKLPATPTMGPRGMRCRRREGRGR